MNSYNLTKNFLVLVSLVMATFLSASQAFAVTLVEDNRYRYIYTDYDNTDPAEVTLRPEEFENWDIQHYESFFETVSFGDIWRGFGEDERSVRLAGETEFLSKSVFDVTFSVAERTLLSMDGFLFVSGNSTPDVEVMFNFFSVSQGTSNLLHEEYLSNGTGGAASRNYQFSMILLPGTYRMYFDTSLPAPLPDQNQIASSASWTYGAEFEAQPVPVPGALLFLGSALALLRVKSGNRGS